MKKIKSISDLTPDDHNANKGTDKGRAVVGESLSRLGAGRSILADKNGRVIAGNKTLEKAAESGFEVEVVRTTGDKLVVVQREDLDLSDPTGDARKLAYADNRAGELGLDWDNDAIKKDLAAGLDLTMMQFDSSAKKETKKLKEWTAEDIKMKAMFLFVAPIEYQPKIRKLISEKYPEISCTEEVVYGDTDS